MGAQSPVSPDEISLTEFEALLAKYPSVLKALSDAKGTKEGQASLEELDEFRYVEALETFDAGKSGKPMSIHVVKRLVEWKLRHGKFRPMLMKLVSSNDPPTVQSTIQQALTTYNSTFNASAAVDELAKLRGIGPATASLLLAVHDSQNVPFFSDEMFYWLCCDGKVSPIKYNVKEYKELLARTNNINKRLGVKAVDVERVAFVLMKQDSSPTSTDTKREAVAPKPLPSKKAGLQTAKRKQSVEAAAEPSGPVRRSKRGKRD